MIKFYFDSLFCFVKQKIKKKKKKMEKEKSNLESRQGHEELRKYHLEGMEELLLQQN